MPPGAQFVNVWSRVRHLGNAELKWGDEVECAVLVTDEATKSVRVQLRAQQIMEHLQKREAEHENLDEGVVWHQEYGRWMIESTPKTPYRGSTGALLSVEHNMRLRRRRLVAALGPGEICPTMVNFPLLGVGAFSAPFSAANGPIARSEGIPDDVINPHPRFGALTANIRARRGANVDIRLPLFRDAKTPEFEDDAAALAPPTVHMDAMAYGMGCCCLQVTFQARDMAESRYMYDQLAVMAPIMLALSAGAPFFKGRIVDTDVRWGVIAASCDDRRPAERGEDADAAADEDMVGHGRRRVYKSRYDSISRYIYTCNPDGSKSCCPIVQGIVKGRPAVDKYHDIECAVDEETRERLVAAGVDEVLAAHIAHLFVRDPLVIFRGSIAEVDDDASTEHFESIQSTNWQTVRWKPPPPAPAGGESSIGWRVEFRSMEIQFTDFENAAFSVFIVLLTRAILAFDLALYMPLSMVDENMRRAHRRDAVRGERFFFRTRLAPQSKEEPQERKAEASGGGRAGDAARGRMDDCSFDSGDECEEMSMAEIFNGKEGGNFPGLVPLIRAYLGVIGCDGDVADKMDRYLTFISRRASGEIQTNAAWMRDFVAQHGAYRGDSRLSEETVYDLCRAIDDIGKGLRHEPSLLGDERVRPIATQEAYPTMMNGRRLSPSERDRVLRDIVKRDSFRKRQKQVETALSTRMTG